jgi:hypothetical protein
MNKKLLILALGAVIIAPNSVVGADMNPAADGSYQEQRAHLIGIVDQKLQSLREEADSIKEELKKLDPQWERRHEEELDRLEKSLLNSNPPYKTNTGSHTKSDQGQVLVDPKNEERPITLSEDASARVKQLNGRILYIEDFEQPELEALRMALDTCLESDLPGIKDEIDNMLNPPQQTKEEEEEEDGF